MEDFLYCVSVRILLRKILPHKDWSRSHTCCAARGKGLETEWPLSSETYSA